MDRLGEAFVVALLGGAVCSLMLFVPLWGPPLVFSRLAARHTAPVRTFSSTDVMVLTVYLAFANALVTLVRDEMTTSWLVALAATANLFVILVWIKAQRFMKERAIHHQPSRVLVQGLLYPMSILVVGILAFNLLTLGSSFELFEDGLASGAGQYFSHPLVIAATVSLLAAMAGIISLRASFRQFVTIGDAAPAQPSRDSDGCRARAAEPSEEREPE